MKIRKRECENKSVKEEEEEEEEEENKTVMVGTKMDAPSRELLTWALVKVASPGDRVVALHIISSSSSAAAAADAASESDEARASSLLDVLSVYDGFCNLKQIDLKLKICRGSSIRKALVREANSCSPVKLILGVAKKSRALGSSSTSIAKYCAKRLPESCSVFAVNNGKILFQKDSRSNPSSKGDHVQIRALGYVATEAARSELKCSNSLALVPVNKSEVGWPLLRKKFILKNSRNCYLERSNMSVVEWAMRLPSRYTAVSSPVHPNHKAISSDINVASSLTSNSGPLVPSETNLIKPSPSICEVEKKIPTEFESLKEKYSSVCTLFSYKELVHITSDFAQENMIGRGGNSHVYKGCCSDGKELAVKILKKSEEIKKEFVSEIEIITALKNNNIISLVGFCFEDDNLILVYDYLPRGSLEEVLHGETKRSDFGWDERYRAAVGVARALDYLHGNGNDQPVIHRDVKSSNILLSSDFEPKLSDFGLALWASNATSQITCNDVAGTFGYLAPEYFMHGKVNEKIDVYAFGVVLLELISGRKPVSTGCPKGHESLVMWANSILRNGKVWQLVDPNLSTECHNDKIERMILAASLCIRRVPQSRPRIALVLKVLQGDDDILKWARSQSSSSEELDRVDDEAAFPDNNIQSFINLALLDVDDDSLSVSSGEHPDFVTANTSLEEYLQGRWSRSSSFQ
uniref:Protein kinase domain-containing protein n=1 Tax=Ananas comosus var. bracteatus TaxID=296719 RepID=A0A6V7QFY3_ANACO|nr:unnamed protein product [Ananas comosus var. bracteatus]